jgi:hypothetical protein
LIGSALATPIAATPSSSAAANAFTTVFIFVTPGLLLVLVFLPSRLSLADVTDSLALFIPRSTEKETWDFALATCDTAAMLLGNGDGKGRRATKWAALALKSRAALHAASVAKYWNAAPLSGTAVDAKLVGGMTQADALEYYRLCIEAAQEIIDHGPFGLFKPSPANPTEAAENYRLLFENPNNA